MSLTTTQQLFSEQFSGVNFECNKSLAPVAYFKIGGPAEIFVTSNNSGEVASIVSWCHENNVPMTILGGASNVIISDKGIPGVTITLNNTEVADSGKEVDGKRIITAGAGTKTALLVSRAVSLGYKGLEYFLGVPGTTGGAIYNNSHYLADLIGEHVHRVEIVTPTGEVKWLTKEECDFGYDHSRFHTSKELIFSVEFALLPGTKEESQAKIREATEYRATTQPLGTPNSGCIFQNSLNTDELRQRFPQFAERTHIPSGFLIDQAGLKGERVGNVEVSHKHAAFIINLGGGTSEEVNGLIAKVKQRVKAEFGVELREEVFYLPKQ
jgi:UDP-N-acetylmuramate dehydrogenase